MSHNKLCLFFVFLVLFVYYSQTNFSCPQKVIIIYLCLAKFVASATFIARFSTVHSAQFLFKIFYTYLIRIFFWFFYFSSLKSLFFGLFLYIYVSAYFILHFYVFVAQKYHNYIESDHIKSKSAFKRRRFSIKKLESTYFFEFCEVLWLIFTAI